MGARQFDKRVAQQLNALEKGLALSAEAIKAESSKYDALFKDVFGIFDDCLEAGAPARFICDDGFVIGRIIPRMSPTVDVKKFIEQINKHMSPGKAVRIIGKPRDGRVVRWVPVVDQAALAIEVAEGRIEHKLVERCITRVKASPRRERHLASAKEQRNLAAGIIESPSWGDEEESA